MTIAARNLTFAIGAKRILDGVSLEARAGELLAVVGPNGSGKSTLLRLLAGEREPTSGSIEFNGMPLGKLCRNDLARRRGMLPQHSSLNFDFEVFDVVLLGRMPHGRRASEEDRKIAHEALAAVDALDLAERIYTTLSGGERQRVHLARVLAQIWNPPPNGGRVLLLDEPTSALDLAHQHRTLALARQWSRGGIAAVVVLHDLNLAAQYADLVVVLERGKLRTAGTPAQALTAETIKCVFGMAVQVVPRPRDGRPYILPAGMDWNEDNNERRTEHDRNGSLVARSA